ncbi:annexin A3 [Solea senegalensis]|uniref:Annexin A3 n=1 Tax=Solea senegalensis TaxID=28829 RepID=A0AAV6QMP3_SOLSE|nr:annexin A3 [Solea senegalensis]
MLSLWDNLEDLLDSDCPENQAGTVIHHGEFDPKQDAQTLKEAMDGIGTKEDILIDILTHRDNAERQLIRKAYQDATGNDLVDDLQSETRGDFEDLVVALVRTPAEFDCHEVMDAIKGAGTKDSVLIEIFASRTNQEIKALNDVHLKEKEYLLIRDLRDELNGDIRKAMLLLVEGERDESADVNEQEAVQDAEAMYQAGEDKWGTDESTFIEILSLVKYKNISEKSLQKSIESEMSGELEELMVAIVKCVKSRPAYFAERLHDSMEGSGTCEATVCRIMVSRSEIDLKNIKAEYKKLYKRSLLSDIEKDLSGHVGDCLKAICGPDDD